MKSIYKKLHRLSDSRNFWGVMLLINAFFGALDLHYGKPVVWDCTFMVVDIFFMLIAKRS